MDDHFGFFLIIAFLLGMGTNVIPPRLKERRKNGAERRTGPKTQINQIYDLLELLVYQDRRPELDQEEKGPAEDGSA